jgi:hypothetical protein
MHEQLEKFIYSKAKSLEDDAAFGGEHHDRGARMLRLIWKAYRAGLNEDDPSSVEGLEAVVKEFNRVNDPSYQEYLKLKQKFG